MPSKKELLSENEDLRQGLEDLQAQIGELLGDEVEEEVEGEPEGD